MLEERSVLVHDRLNVRPEILALLTHDELEDIEQENNLWYKQKFLKSALENKVNGVREGHGGCVDYQYDPETLEYRYLISSVHLTLNQVELAVNDTEMISRYIVTNETTLSKMAFLYTIRALQEADITVVLLINMPLRVELSQKNIRYIQYELF